MAANATTSLILLNLLSTVRDPSNGALVNIGPNLAPIRLASGIGYDQADLAYESHRTLSASSNEDLNIYGGFEDGLGNTVTLAKVKLILIINWSTTQVLGVEAGSADPFVGMITGTSNNATVQPAAADDNPGIFVWYSPKGTALASGAGKINVSNPSGASASYSIYVIGTSA